MTPITIVLDDEHLAMLDALRSASGRTRAVIAKALLFAVLEDDAVAHGAAPSRSGNVVVLREWRAP